MTFSFFIRKLIKPFICAGLVSLSANVNAQVSLAQVIDKIETYKNLTYLSTNRKMEIFTLDTVTEQLSTTFVKVSEDKDLGYFISTTTLNEKPERAYTNLYDGKNLVRISSKDSTYEILKKNSFDMQGTVLGCLRWLQDRLEKKLSRMVKARDTTINGIDSYHLFVDVYDTMIDKEHNYTYADLYIDKLLGVPDYVEIKSRSSNFGDGITNYYSGTRYFDYRFNQDNPGMASMSIPPGFHPPKEAPILPKQQTDLLTSGSFAPDWSLFDADGKKMSLTRMKGKVAMLDFFFIGCGGCMMSLKPLNRLHEKYKGRNVEIASMTFRDSAKAVVSFQQNYHIKYPIYINAGDVVESYHVTGFPTFYFIDKTGKIATVFVGYSEDFEKKATSIIDALLHD